MAGLRKLFGIERTFSASPDPDHAGLDPSEVSSRESSSVETLRNSFPETNARCLSPMDSQQFIGIEKQVEELYEQLHSRASVSSGTKRFKYIESRPPTSRTRRHVDVLEAIFSSHRDRISSNPLAPSFLYNEDIADRNLHTRQGMVDTRQYRYARASSGVYQEDVANRNILLSGGTIPYPDSSSGGSPYQHIKFKVVGVSTSHSQETRPAIRLRSRISHRTHPSGGNEPRLRVTASEQDLRRVPQKPKQECCSSDTTEEPSVGQLAVLRSRKSAPVLSVTTNPGRYQDRSQQDLPLRAPEARSDVSATAKSTTSSKTAGNGPAAISNNDNSQDLEQKLDGKPAAAQQKEGTPSHPHLPVSRTSARRNVRDLSIDTKLAAPRKFFVKVGCHPVNAPVSAPQREPNTTGAEVVNSPVSIANSAGASPKAASYNITEIMDLFKQAYVSSKLTNQNPTFETLQDAIVREINSHDALLQFHPDNVIPESSEPDSQDTENTHAESARENSTKGISIKEKQSISLSRKTSLARQGRNSETLGRQLSLTALKNDESDEGNDLECEPKRECNSGQPLSAKVERKHALSEGACVDEAPGVLQDIAPNISSPRRPLEATSAQHPQSTDIHPRPQSSHSFKSRKVSLSFAITEASKWPHYRRSQRHAREFRLAGKHATAVRRDDVNRPLHTDPPAIQVTHRDEEKTTEQPTLSDRKSFPSTSPPNPERDSVKKYHKTLLFPVGRNEFPRRTSSLRKDLFDSGRFRW